MNTTNPDAPITDDDDGAFTVREFCARYSIGVTAFYDEISNKRLTAKKRGKRTLVPRASARAWLNALPNMEPSREQAA